MLTALSVARDCEMIEKDGRVILVHVVPPTDGTKPAIEWTCAEDVRDDMQGGEIFPKKVCGNSSEDNSESHIKDYYESNSIAE